MLKEPGYLMHVHQIKLLVLVPKAKDGVRTEAAHQITHMTLSNPEAAAVCSSSSSSHILHSSV